MQIDFLYIDGCPSWESGLENLKLALSAEGVPAEIRLIKVSDNEEAALNRFLGSPSFQINGSDLWPEEREIYALCCRVYLTPSGLQGAPSVDMLREKIRKF